MSKQSAGMLVYRKRAEGAEVLIAHPGGPFWAKKDKGAWSIPKGELNEGEDGLGAAKREFAEEIGQPAPEGEYLELGFVKNKSGKTIYAWAIEGDLDVRTIKSNLMSIEWPPRSGKQLEFPEVDRAEWMTFERAIIKLNPAQVPLIERLAEQLGETPPQLPEQASLF